MLRPSSTGTSRPRTTDRLGVRVRSPINGSGMRHVTGRDYVNYICSVPRGCLHIYLLIYDLKCMNWRSSASMTQHRLASVLNSRSIRKFDATSARWYAGVPKNCTNVRLTWFQFFIWNQRKAFYKASNISFPWRFLYPYCFQGEVDQIVLGRKCFLTPRGKFKQFITVQHVKLYLS